MRLNRMYRHAAGTGVAIAALAATLVVTTISGRSSAHPPADPKAKPLTAEQPDLRPPQQVQRAVQDVTLPTGDRVRLSRAPNGKPTVSPLPPDAAHPGSGSHRYTQFTMNGDMYVIPGSALRGLGSVLDMSLFDVSYLARAGYADGQSSSLPMVATLDKNATTPAVPGLTVNGSGGDRSARLDKAQAWRLGRQVARSGSVPGVRHLTLAPAKRGVAGPPTAHGNTFSAAKAGIPRRTLKIHTIDRTGAPSFAIVFVQNVDDIQRYFGLAVVAAGDTYLSVPDGTYSVAANVIRLHDTADLGYDSAFVTEPEVAVHAASVSVTLDARTANPVTAAVDGQHTNVGVSSIAFDRRAGGGEFYYGSGIAWATGGLGNEDSPLFATPTAPVKRGSFAFDAYFITSPGPTFDPLGSHYLLDFPDARGVPASTQYNVSSRSLTRVNERYHYPNFPAGTPTSALAQGFNVVEPWAAYGTGYWVFLDGTPRAARTDYLYSPPDTLWYQFVQTPDFSFYLDSWRHIEPGSLTDEWFKAPVVPGAIQREDLPFEVPAGVQAPDEGIRLHTYGCPACRQDDNLDLRILSGADSQPGHFPWQDGDQHTVSSTTRFYQDGKLAMTSIMPFADYPLLPRAATYRLDWDYSKTEPRWPLSTHVQTSWTFRSDPRKRGQAPPAYEDCVPDPTVRCSMLPLLFLNYDLPLALDNTAAAGSSLPITVQVSRQQHMTAPHGLSATVQVSYDDGATWSDPHPMHAHGAGRFTVPVTQPSTAGYASLRVHASDADGNSITQTVIRAYEVAVR